MRRSKDHRAFAFFATTCPCSPLGAKNAHEVETIVKNEIEAHQHELTMVSGTFTNIADGMPAVGIVAAMLGRDPHDGINHRAARGSLAT